MVGGCVERTQRSLKLAKGIDAAWPAATVETPDIDSHSHQNCKKSQQNQKDSATKEQSNAWFAAVV